MDRKTHILLISAHWVPSNLTGVHRARLCANAMARKGLKVTVLTVDPEYYEEPPDNDLYALVEPLVQVVKVSAYTVKKPRLIGDIGLRGFFQLKSRAIEMLKSDQFDKALVFIPSFYSALMLPFIKRQVNIPIGIDYIDPWVRSLGNRKGFRAKFSLWLAKVLEPLAVRRMDFVTGVSASYFEGAVVRNKLGSIPQFAFPYGLDSKDYTVDIIPEIPDDFPTEKVILYAGAMLPNSLPILEWFFGEFQKHAFLRSYHLVFIGTGTQSNSPIQSLAKKHGLTNIYEDPKRWAYLSTIAYQKRASANLVIGSVEAHYTPSKVFQNLMVQKPVFLCTHGSSPIWKELAAWKGIAQVPWFENKPSGSLDSLVEIIEKEIVPSGNFDILQVDQKIAPFLAFLNVSFDGHG